MKKDIIPGWAFILSIGLLASFFSKTIVVGGKNPVEAAVIAIVIGIFLRTFNFIPAIFAPGIKSFEKLLIIGIVLVGAALNFSLITSQGLGILLIVVATMTIGFVTVFFLAKALKLPLRLALLLSAGTSICGGTAIAVIAPLIDAKEEDTSYAIGTIALWGLLALLLYPLVAQAIGVSDIQFGVFAGTAIHSTPQVVGAGFIFSELAGQVATAVKLLRNCLLAPMSLLIVFLV